MFPFVRFLSGSLATLWLVACATYQPLLNSDRIEQKFGSYGVEVVRQNETRRVSSLYSLSGGEHITRTWAIVEFLSPNEPALDKEHEAIFGGASIGRTFRDAGWTIYKAPLGAEEVVVSTEDAEIGAYMHINLPARLAAWKYEFVVSREGQTFDYARITEIYHPDYLDFEDLLRISATPQ